jgi:hypothetical protein
MGNMRNSYKIFVRNPKERDHLEYLGVDWKIILERILGKYGLNLWTGFIRLSLGISGGFL